MQPRYKRDDYPGVTFLGQYNEYDLYHVHRGVTINTLIAQYADKTTEENWCLVEYTNSPHVNDSPALVEALVRATAKGLRI